MANYIYSTDTTYTAITKINNLLTGGTYDDSSLLWISSSDSAISGYSASILKRDDNYPNIILSAISNTIAGGANSGNTHGFLTSYYSTIFGGTGNSVNFLINTIFGGENNAMFVYNPGLTSNFQLSSIFAGIQNEIFGNYDGFSYSSILNGSGNSMYNETGKFSYDDSYSINTIVNGLSNDMDGIFGYSWIGNGSGNSITTNSTNTTVGNYIFNGYNNTISYPSSNYRYNTIFGGKNNVVSDVNNTITIGSDLTPSENDTTYVNNLFFKNKMFANNFTFSSYTLNNGGFDHQNRLVGIISGATLSGSLTINLSAGTYVGQVLYLIGIPSVLHTTIPNRYYTSDIVLNDTTTEGNIIGLQATAINFGPALILNNSWTQPTFSFDPTLYSGLGIFVWNGQYWIKSDYRGGI